MPSDNIPRTIKSSEERLDIQRRFRLSRAAQGLCVTCGKKNDHTATRCKSCTAKTMANNTRIKKRVRELGFCEDCRKPWKGLTKRCEECKDRQREKWSKRADERYCVRCVEPRDSKHKACSKCRKHMRQIHKVRRSKFRSEGKCIQCGVPCDAHGQYCSKHIFQAAARRWLGDSKLWNELKDLFESQNGFCALTGEKLIIGDNASVDHKTPRSKGGEDRIENLQWVTMLVNRAKSDLNNEEFVEMCRSVTLVTMSD